MKNRPVEAKLFHANRRTDMTKVMDAFRNFAITTSKDIVGFYLALKRCVKKMVYCR